MNNENNEWQQGQPTEAAQGPSGETVWTNAGTLPYPPGYDPGAAASARKKKSKWLAGLLSFIFPGSGYMYLGLMGKGVMMMLLLALNICGVVFVVQEMDGNVLTVVLVSLLLPILYLYNLFDTLQSADAVNDRIASGGYYYRQPPYGWDGRPATRSESDPRAVPALSIVLLAAGAAILLGSSNIRWLFHSAGAMIGALVLIGAGVALWLWENRGQQGRKS
ncbi:hypothetical protein [Cohnella sp. JJ-181]|uniref:hypothetical protein n=1 Tax=Cohnella rhizoplanae TaxID=2974897 RepID=UPI0022FF8CFB|nr:hypothetical protein [Cohnella sp. JJ-181]CAI6080269.1 hypothetical protein COHCIP112018_02935 [Cohnella sp. JJ-181]